MTTEADASGDGVQELVRQRDQLRVWIEKLDQKAGGTSSKVTARVRADYEDRLRRVIEDLAAHGAEIAEALEQMRGELAAAEERRGEALEELEETRLRHEIGELDEAAWEGARQPLEAVVAEAEAAVARAAGEVERLYSLSGEITPEAEDGGTPAPAAPSDEASAEVVSHAGSEPGIWSAGGDGAAEEFEPDFGDAAAELSLEGGSDSGQEPEPEEDPAEEVDDLPLQRWDDEPEEQAAAPEDAAAAGEVAPTPEAGLPAEPPSGPVSGADLAAWISEVEAESGTGADSGTADAEAEPADGWDPFANEFGGTPAAPTTRPGDGRQAGPWTGGAHGQPPAPPAGDDDLAFLEHLDEPATPAAPAPTNDLADDDLAFLEELDRAISGGAQRPAAGEPPAPPADEITTEGYTGGSGGGNFAPPPSEAVAEQRKRGEALLCKECGAINEPQAWYCEICGSEL